MVPLKLLSDNNMEYIVGFISSSFKVFNSNDSFMFFCSRTAQVTFIEIWKLLVFEIIHG